MKSRHTCAGKKHSPSEKAKTVNMRGTSVRFRNRKQIHKSADNSSKILQQISKMMYEKSRIENRHTEERNSAQKYHQETEMNITWNGVHERLKQKMRESNQWKKILQVHQSENARESKERKEKRKGKKKRQTTRVRETKDQKSQKDYW
jgi:hypothetical protein